MRAALPRLRRRIADIEAFDTSAITERFSPEAESLQTKVDTTLDEVFGPGTIERDRFSIALDRAPQIIGGIPLHELIDGYHRGCVEALATLRTVIELFEEELGDFDDCVVSSAMRAVDNLDLNPAIALAASQRFKDGQFADAIEAACKALVNLVQNASGEFGKDGVDLMHTVFSAKAPVLHFE